MREVSPVEHKVSKFDAMKCLLQNIHSVKSKIGLHPSKSPMRGHQSATRVKSQNFAHQATMGSKPKLLSNPTQPFHMASLHNLPKSRLMQKKPASSLIFSQLPKGPSSSTRVLPGQTSTRQLKHANKASIGYVPVPLVHPGVGGAGHGSTTIQATTLNIIGSTFTVNSLPQTLAKHASVDETVAQNSVAHLPQQNSTEQFFWPTGILTKSNHFLAKPAKDAYCSSLDFGPKKPKTQAPLPQSSQTKVLPKQTAAVFRRTLSTSVLADTKTLKKTQPTLVSGTSSSQRLPGKGATIKKLAKATHKSSVRVV